MKKYLLEKVIKFIRYSKEKTYRYILKYKTKCSCFLCKAKMKYVEYRVKRDSFYCWLYELKWVNVEFWGSDYSDFREYKVISKQRVRMPDGKGFKWPKTNYNHIKIVETGVA